MVILNNTCRVKQAATGLLLTFFALIAGCGATDEQLGKSAVPLGSLQMGVLDNGQLLTGRIAASGASSQTMEFTANEQVELTTQLLQATHSGWQAYDQRSLTFSVDSQCAISGLARLTNLQGEAFSSGDLVRSIMGQVRFLYQPLGFCEKDGIRITLVDDELASLNSQLSFTVSPSLSSALAFAGFDPAPAEGSLPTLRLQGGVSSALLPTSRTASFQLLDHYGSPLQASETALLKIQTPENLSALDRPSFAGGGDQLELKTDGLGRLTVTVMGGKRPTLFNIEASLKDRPEIRTLSPSLLVSSGLPASLILYLEYKDPSSFEEGVDFRDFTITALVADQLKNPVPDGTLVQFTASAGLIESACLTLSGYCYVNWAGSLSHSPLSITAQTLGDAGQRIVRTGTWILPAPPPAE